MNRCMIIKILLLMAGLNWNCGNTNESGGGYERPDPNYRLPYHLREPNLSFELDNDLEEISGLTLSADGNQLVAIQDEDGLLFFLNKETGEIEREVEFWKDGDYEGVEFAGEDYYVVKSSGTLYRVRRAVEDRLSVEKFNDFLGQKNDVEGLAYDAANRRLLLACKGDAGEGDDYDFKKAIYAFDLSRMKLLPEPAYLISLEDVQAYLNSSPTIRKLEKLMDEFSPGESEFVFGPSGMAIHPITGNFYLLSAVGNLLMVLNSESEILHLEKLDKDLLPQAEGLCFEPDGTLYLSSEGSGRDPVVHRYAYQPQR